MRLHELEVSAFGPFTDPVRIDLDALATGGLFLLTGPTGSGKTSVLDAVCFALYGDVPGERSSAKRLRSDQAGPDAAPSVRLVATLAGRRFEIIRSPAWRRPKRRGAGTTPQQASVVVREQVDGAWTTLATRLDEAGQLVTSLLGMNLAQFTQVAMLPQGRFQAFLRAGSDERQRLLQQLFGTDRFERAEAWLRERRADVRDRHERAHLRLSGVVGRVGEVAGLPAEDLPDWDAADLAAPARAGEIAAWVGELSTRAGAERDHLGTEREQAAQAEVRSRTALERARVEAERRERRGRARRELDALEQQDAVHRDDQRRLDAARRARAVTPLRVLLGAAERHHATDLAEHERALADAATLLGPAPGGAGPHWWVSCADDAVAAAGAVVAARPAEERAARLAADLAATRDDLEREEARVAALATVAHAAPVAIEAVRVRLRAAERAEVLADAEHARVRALEVCVAAGAEAEEVRGLLVTAREDRSRAREAVDEARTALLDLRERRIAGMAAEIAGDLAVGQCCPVCGSADHPAKARTRPGSPDADAERRAQHEVDQANTVALLRDEAVRSLEARRAAALARADRSSGDPGDPGDPATALDRARDSCAALEAEASARPVLATELDRLERELAGRRTELAAARDAVTRAVTRAAALAEELAGARAEVTAVRGEHVDLATAERHHLDRAGAARRVGRAVVALDASRRRAAEARADLVAAARAAGFPDTDQAQDAALDPAALDALDDAVAAHRDRLSAARAVLRDTEPSTATGPTHGTPATPETAPLDVDALAEQHADLLSRLADVRAREHHLDRRAARLVDLRSDVDDALAEWRPLRDELDLVTDLSAFVDGRSPANRWQIRLSAYVLAFRLSQVVAAANVRLGRMSDQRYSLEHTADRGRERRGGLGLLVRDDWSGRSRDPATLSGGETFVVSLALALGLADVVSAEAGGATLDTLFVDEGFGSLDADTLDDVMGTLDSLRDGGRVVGVVSHVAEMRDRIPTQLRVTKARRGSDARVHGAGAPSLVR